MRPLPIVFLLAVALRVGAQVALGAYAKPETWEYESIANNLLAGHGYTYAAGGITYVASVSSPLYVLLTAGIYALSGHSAAAMLVLQAVIGGLTASLAAWLAARTFNVDAAWAAGALVAVDPALVVYSTKLHPLSLDALGFVAVACAVVALRVKPAWQQTAAVGVLVGLTALTRTTALMFIPLILIWGWTYRALGLVSPAAIGLVTAAVLVYSPWPVRNSMLLNQLVLGSSESTEWFWRGTNPSANGSSLLPDGRTMLQAAPPEFQARVLAATEAERMQLYQSAAMDFIRQQPLDAAGLYVAKLRTFWWGSEVTGQLYPAGWIGWYSVWYLTMVALAAWGVWQVRAERQARANVVLVIAMLLLISLSQAVFYVEGRHRLAVEPLLLILSGGGLASLARLTWRSLPQSRRALRDA